MRGTWLSGNGWRSGLARRLGRRVRRVATGAGTLALAVPLAWPSGVGGQHLDVPTASAVRSGAVRLADWVTRDAAPAPTVPVQQGGSAAGAKHLVPASSTRGLKHVAGHAPGAGQGQLPAWAAHAPRASASGTFTSGSSARGFDPVTSTLDQSGATARTDLYKNADGSYTRKVWSTPVNYQTPSGSWAPIDPTLAPGPAGRWREKANALAVSFAASGSDPALGTLASADGSQQVSFSLAGAGGVAASASGSSVTYPGILPGTDVTETATPDGMSEALTLASAASGTSWTFPLTLKGLTASLDGDTVDLADATGKVVGVIPPATASSGPVNLADPGSQATSQLTYQLVTAGGVTALRMNLDPAWLNAPGRVFPVTVDPTMSLDTQGSTLTQSVNGTAQTGNNSGATLLRSGTTTSGGSTYSDIALLDFSEVGTNFANAHLTSASLKLFEAYASQCTTAASVGVYQVTSSWSLSQSLTYPGPPYGTLDAGWSGIAAAHACSNTSGLLGTGAWLTIGFNTAGLGLLNQWTANSTPNWGLAVVTSLSNSSMWKQFDSYNDSNVAATQGGDCTGDCRPFLQLTYTTTASDVAPQVNSQYPPQNYNSPTLTPELTATGADADTYPDATPQYKFSLFTSAGSPIDNSGLVSSGDWTVPAGDLAWGQSYYWTVQAYDGALYSPNPQADFFTTEVPQPLITSQLSQNPAGPGFNPQTGNWTSSATDAQVPGSGPALSIIRDYNSTDARLSGAFGAGWSSVLDMKVSPGENGGTGTAATQVVTYPDGEEVGFGLNADGLTYSPPPGRFATLAPVAGGGFTLTDKNDTVYKFTQSLGSGAYGITSITDALGRAETFTYASGHITAITSASGRTLTITWTTPAGAGYAHVTSVVTPDATAGNSATAQNWTYNYAADQLSAACPPASATVCTAYTYVSGSDYQDAVLDSGPHSYWRLDETSGGTAASSVLANEHADDATYNAVTLGQDGGPLAGSPAKAGYFTGASSFVTLPKNLVTSAQYQSISLWFKTTTVDGVLWASSASGPSGSTTGNYTPELYVGDDGKLVGAFWDGNASDVMSSSAAVDDGQWHNAVLADTASGQWLYLDGQQIGTLAHGFASQAQINDYVGAGFLGGGWPDEPHYNTSGNNTGFAYGFVGDISDAAIWYRQVTPAEVQAMYAAGTHQAALLTNLTQPSGSVDASVSYDPLTSRVTSDTDTNNGIWHLNPPTSKGSSQGWVASVLGAHPSDYFRLNDTGAAQPFNSVFNCACSTQVAYNNVTEGVTNGPFADQPVPAFNGTSSDVDMPLSDTASTAPGTAGLWFKTTGTSQVLYSEEGGPVSGSTSVPYSPVLYIGQDGKLNGEFYDGNTTTAVSHAAVNDGQWHYAVLAAGASSQSLYVDGTLQATISGSVRNEQWTNVTAGAGFTGGAWPDIPSTTVTARWFNGNLAELAWYPYQLSAAQVSGQWNTVQYATGLTPDQVSTVTDPGGNTLTDTYDLLNGGRQLTSTNAEGGITGYTYDTGGFPASVTDPDGDITQTGYDPRGNLVSKSTCQDQANTECSTSYWTYYPNDTATQLPPAATNDLVKTYADGRSASASDTTYQATYSYDSVGDLTGVTTPPVAGSPSGRTTRFTYTTGTTTGGYQSAVPPKGLPYQATTAGGAVTTTLYYADGDLAQVTDADGQRTVYTYDGLGRKTSQTLYSDAYAGGLATNYTYDADGRQATETDPGVRDAVTGAVHTAQTTTTYDADGDLLTQVVTDQTGHDATRTETRTYNSYDQLASDTDPAGGQTTYTYDGYGNTASRTDPDGNVTEYAYNGDGQLLSTTLENYTGSPPGSQAAAPLPEESRGYDPAGRLAQVTDAEGRLTNYYYTDNGLLAGIVVASVGPDGQWTSSFTTEWNAYDGAGNLVERWTNNGATDTTYTVDAASRVTQQVTDPSGLDRITSVSYTPDDQQASVTDSGPDGATQTTSSTYDPAGNVLSQSVTDPGSGGPAAWYNLSQSSGTAVPDRISGGQPATASGVTWDSSEGTFSGTSGSQVTTTGPLLDTTGSFSVAAWVNLTGSTGADQVIASQAAAAGPGFALQYDPGTGNWELARPLADTAGATAAVAGSGANATAATGTWTFVAGTYNANTGTLALYVNGVPAGTATDTTPVAAHGPFTIGSAKANGAQGDWFAGQAADVQVYPRALSASEVGTLYGSSDGGDITTSQLTTTWTRDQRGLPTSVTDPDGALTSYTYDQAGQLVMTQSPAISAEAYGVSAVAAYRITSTGYDTFGDVAETKDADGNVTTDGYDADGRQVSQALPPYTPPGGSPVTAVDTTAYDGDGLVTSSTDGLNNTTHYGYDQLGDQVTVTAPDTSVTTTAYDKDGEPRSVTSPTGAVTQATYDYLGRRLTGTQVERSTGAGTTAAYITNYSYNDTPDSGGGFLSQQTSPDGVSTSYSHDAAGEVTSVADGAGDTTSYAYNALGQPVKETYPDGTATATGYDGAGNPVSVRQLDASGTTLSTTSAAYDGEGDQLSATDAAGNSSTFTYDPTGMLTQELQPVSATSGITTSFGYDAAGNQTRYTDGKGDQWWDTYNSWGLQESRVEPFTSAYNTPANSTFTTAYDADGNPVTETEPGGVTITDAYNNLDEVTGQSGSGADAATPTRTFGYDTDGDLTSATTTNTASTGSNATSESFTYDDRGLLLTAAGTAGSTSVGYNGDGLVTSTADAAGSTSYTYDNADRLATLSDPATGTTGTYAYNADSLVTGISYGSGKDKQSFGYDSQHRLTSDTLNTSSGTTIASVGYGYNADGLITSETAAGLAGPASSTYTYDEAGRLTSWGNGTTTTQYGYDPNGNLTQAGAKTYTYDARDELTSDGTSGFTYTARGTPSAEPASGGPLAVTFDAYGDQATAGTRSYGYDGLGRLTSDAGSTGTPYAFSYVGSGGAIASDGTSTYTWDPSGSELAGIGVANGTTSQGVLALANAHGDVVGQFTAAGTSVSGSKAYDPWGTVTATTGSVSGLLGFQSAWSDPASGKDLMGARWYDPAAGDFTSADSVQVPAAPDSAAADPFGYVQDEPLDLTDPSGHCFLCSVVSAVTSVVKTVVHATTAVVSTAASYTVAVAEAVRAAAARAVTTVAAKVVDAAKTVVKTVTKAVKAVAKTVTTAAKAVTKTVTTAVKTAAKKVTTAVKTVAKTVSKAAKTVAKTVTTAAKTVAKTVTTAAKAVTRTVVSAAAQAESAAKDAASAVSTAARSGLGQAALALAAVALPMLAPLALTDDLSVIEAHWQGLLQIGMVVGAVALTVANVLQLGLDPLTDAAEAVDVGALVADAGAEGAEAAASTGAEGAASEGAADVEGASAGEDPAEDGPSSCSTGGQSFTAGTLVLLASGKAVPISALKAGDKVLATDTKTGKDQPEAVTAVLVHHDTDLYDLKVKTTHGVAVIHTTSNHLFWDPSLNKFIRANHLKSGEHLKTPDGRSAVVVGGSTPADHDGWMWDLTVQDDHDFYVEPVVVLPPSRAGPAVLVHNCTVDPATVKFSQRSVSARFKNGATIEDTVAGIGAGDIDPGGFPPIRLVERDGDLYTLDNRRLVTFQKAGLAEVPYVMATPEEAESEMWKFDPDAAGTSIKIRGTGEVWAP